MSNAKLTAMICAAVALSVPVSSSAGIYADDLARCLVRSTSQADKNTLVQWMFGMASLHPDVKTMATVTDADRAGLNKRMAGLMERLLTQACVKEAQEAIKYEGIGTLESGFTVLGQVAGRELFANPAVAAAMGAFEKYFDKAKVTKALGLPK